MKRRLMAICLSLCLLATCLLPTFGALAATEVTGTVVGIDEGHKLYVRQSASTGATILDKLYNGDIVTIHDTVEAGGITWYKITTHNNVVGFSSAAYIKLNVTYQTNEEFEAYLTAQKFPEDYKVKLRQLWAEHPTWVFKAQHLSMTWATALQEEQKALKNAITQPDSWKSMEDGAYNWNTGSYVVVDSGGWVTAAQAVVAFYMDPLNFLDDVFIFQFEDLQYSDEHTVEGVKAILPSRYDAYAEDLLKAAKETKVSAYFLATRMTQEGSKINGSWEGDDGVLYENVYNFFNYGAYAGSQYGSYHGAVTNGAIYAKRQGWDTPYKCLVGSAEKIGNSYINKGQNTLYYQKFNVAGENLYNHQYMTNVQAPASEGKIRSNSATAEEKAGSLTFLIPVYKEMQTEPTALPGKTGNNNNFLDSLTVEGCKLSPTFDRYTMEYTGEVGEEVTEIQLSAVKNSADASVSGTGTVKLKPGENTIPITVTATSGQVRVYTVILTAPGGEELPDQPGGPGPDNPAPDNPDQPTPPAPTPTLTGTIYSVAETVSGVSPETSVDTLLKNLGVKDGTASLQTADGKDKTSGIVATGDILRIYNQDAVLYKSSPVVVHGDVNGDGKVNSQDLRRAQRPILGAAALKGYYLTAADVNGDGKVNSQDLRRSQRFILGSLNSLLPTQQTNP
ncbi:MAG: SH3 domain-containing protein [Clostridia bacterium]|nr:SH3 domain-containing protein [Clostridia bacterium]